MELNVAKELKLVGRVSEACLQQEYPVVELSGRSIRLTLPVTVEVRYYFDGEGFCLSGQLSSAAAMNCTKCNEEFIEPFSVDFSERFLRVGEKEADLLDCYPYSGEVLSLDKMVQDLIVLNAPVYGLCKPDCKGLCPVCGTNLNYTQCSCTALDDGNPFAVLKGLADLLND